MSEKVAFRLRQYQLQSRLFFIGLRTPKGWIGGKLRTLLPTNDGKTIYQTGIKMLATHWSHDPVSQVQITALEPQSTRYQLDMFDQSSLKTEKVNEVMDLINIRYGEFTLMSASLLNRSSMPNVISPAWKPDGIRQTIWKSAADNS